MADSSNSQRSDSPPPSYGNLVSNCAPPAPPPPVPSLQQQQQAPVMQQAPMQQQSTSSQSYIGSLFNNMFGSATPSKTKSKARSNKKTGAVPIEVAVGKPKDDKHTVVAMVVDRSGSMSSMRAEVYGGCNAYLEEQRKSDTEDGNGAHSTVIFTRFDNFAETLYDGVPLTTMPPISASDVQPRGSTALYDAIGETLTRTAELVNGMESSPSVVIFILTDGHENASQTWTKSAITREIKKLQMEDIGWDFYFAAANQDGMAEGSSLGMDSEQCTTYAMSSGKMAYAMQASNMAFQRKKKGGVKGYSASERLAMI